MTESLRRCKAAMRFKPSATQFTQLTVLFIPLAIVSGCGGADLPQGVAISGKVTLNGKTLTSGRVFYHPTGDEGKPAVGDIQSDGTFVMNTSAGIEGVIPGEYQVTVSAQTAAGTVSHPKDAPPPADPRAAVESPIPAKYSNAKTSGLTDSVSESHSGTNNIELKAE